MLLDICLKKGLIFFYFLPTVINYQHGKTGNLNVLNKNSAYNVVLLDCTLQQNRAKLDRKRTRVVIGQISPPYGGLLHTVTK